MSDDINNKIRKLNKEYLNLAEDVKLADVRFSNMWLRLRENEKAIEKCAKLINSIVELLKLNLEKKEK